LASLNQKELLLYFFLVLASDRYGLSFYSYDAICSLLGFSVDDYMEARDGLIHKALIAFDGTLFQVLGLPSKPLEAAATELVPKWDRAGHRSHVRNLVQQSFQRKLQTDPDGVPFICYPQRHCLGKDVYHRYPMQNQVRLI
jgi:hypothetical protein